MNLIMTANNLGCTVEEILDLMEETDKQEDDKVVMKPCAEL